VKIEVCFMFPQTRVWGNFCLGGTYEMNFTLIKQLTKNHVNEMIGLDNK